MSDSLRPHELQHSRPPCPSQTPGVYSNSCPSSWWRHPTISSSVVPFSSCPPSLPASGSFPMSQLFAWGGQSIGVSASASVLPMNTQDWSPLGWTGWISLQFKKGHTNANDCCWQLEDEAGAEMGREGHCHLLKPGACKHMTNKDMRGGGGCMWLGEPRSLGTRLRHLGHFLLPLCSQSVPESSSLCFLISLYPLSWKVCSASWWHGPHHSTRSRGQRAQQTLHKHLVWLPW